MVVRVCTHPLMRHKLTFLRDKSVAPKEFRELSKEIATLLAYEAMTDLPTKERMVVTPFKETKGEEVDSTVALIPVMRSGLGMLDGFIYAYPMAQIWHVGMYRDPKTLVPVEYYNRFTQESKCDVAYVLDPSLSDGSVAKAAISTVQDWGVKNIKLVSFVAAPEGVKAVEDAYPGVEIVVGAIDDCLTPDAMISPGMGDMGSRFFGTS